MAAGRDIKDAKGGATYLRHLVVAMFSPSCPEGRGKPMLGGELRWKDRLLSRTRMCVDRVGAFDDMIEGKFRMLIPQLQHDKSCT
jgi:hypothetical protein